LSYPLQDSGLQGLALFSDSACEISLVYRGHEPDTEMFEQPGCTLIGVTPWLVMWPERVALPARG
jgi:hypothetical protein